MANMLFANNANTTLSSSLTNSATSMSVTSASAFPSPTGSQYFYCTLADAATQQTIEIIKVTAVSGTTFTIVRGQDGTLGTAFNSGDVVSLRLVRASLNDFPKLDEANTFTQAQTFSALTAGRIPFSGTGGLQTDSANLFWDSTNNRLGLGTTSPSQVLTVGSSSFRGTASINGGTPFLIINDTTTSGHQYNIYGGASAVGNLDIYDSTAGAFRMVLFGSGGVSIGNTTDPGATNLSVTGSISGASVSSTGTISGADIVSTVNGTQLTLQRLGPSATNTMSCGGSGELAFVNSSANAFTLYNTYAFFPTAATTASAANAFINNGSAGYANQLLRSTSSLKYKTNVEDLLPEFSKLIYKLRPIWYRSLAEADNKEWSWYGLAAEEVALIEPRLVHWTYEDNQYDYVSIEIEGSNQERRILKSDAVKTPDGIQYDRISILLLKELQQLRSEFDAYVASHP